MACLLLILRRAGFPKLSLKTEPWRVMVFPVSSSKASLEYSSGYPLWWMTPLTESGASDSNSR